MRLSNSDKAALVGLAVGGIGVTIAAGLAEVNSVKPSKHTFKLSSCFINGRGRQVTVN